MKIAYLILVSMALSNCGKTENEPQVLLRSSSNQVVSDSELNLLDHISGQELSQKLAQCGKKSEAKDICSRADEMKDKLYQEFIAKLEGEQKINFIHSCEEKKNTTDLAQTILKSWKWEIVPQFNSQSICDQFVQAKSALFYQLAEEMNSNQLRIISHSCLFENSDEDDLLMTQTAIKKNKEGPSFRFSRKFVCEQDIASIIAKNKSEQHKIYDVTTYFRSLINLLVAELKNLDSGLYVDVAVEAARIEHLLVQAGSVNDKTIFRGILQLPQKEDAARDPFVFLEFSIEKQKSQDFLEKNLQYSVLESKYLVFENQNLDSSLNRQNKVEYKKLDRDKISLSYGKNSFYLKPETWEMQLDQEKFTRFSIENSHLVTNVNNSHICLTQEFDFNPQNDDEKCLRVFLHSPSLSIKVIAWNIDSN